MTVKWLGLSIILIISGCSQQISPTAPRDQDASKGVGVTQVEELISDLTIRSAVDKGSQELQYAKYQMYSLSEPFQSYRHVLVSNLNSRVVKVGLLNENSSKVDWFEPASAELEQCVLTRPMTFIPLRVSQDQQPSLQIQLSSLPEDVAVACAGMPHVAWSYVLMINHSVYVAQAQSERFLDTRKELDSLIVPVLGTNLMLHLDDFTAPTFAVIHQYLDEHPTDPLASNPKRLRNEFLLKAMDSAEAFFEKVNPLAPEVIPDPIQKDCTAVHVPRGDEQIYISFRQVSDQKTSLLDDLCGIYFERTRKLYSVESRVGSFVDI